MAGLYGTLSSLVPGMASDAEEASTFVNQLLQNSTSSCMVSKTKTLPSPWGSPNVGALGFFPSEDPLEDPQRFGQFGNESGSDYQVKNGKLVAATSNAVADSSSSFNFSNPYDYVRDGKKDGMENDFFSTGVEDSDADTSFKENRISPENNSGDFICHVEKNSEGSEFPSKPVPPRTSSKRSRAAEVHNLSEKRRRSRINEKMKALQNLIPNSTKTDKASMLDEAIEYLKQLQLQVQMLMIRNGLSLHPMCLPGGLQPMVLSQTGMSFDEGHGFLNSSSGIAQNLVQSAFSLPKRPNTLNQSAIIPTVTNNINLDTSSISQPTAEVRVGHFNPSASSIDALDGTPQLLLDPRKIGKPSSDVF